MSRSQRNPNDATIDIPLTTVNSRGQTGARRVDGNLAPNGFNPSSNPPAESPNEKTGLFHRHRGPGGRRRKLENEGRAQQTEDDGTLTSMGKIYTAILNFSVVTRYFLYVLPLALMIAVPIVIGATAAPRAQIGGVRIVWFFSWVEIVWLSLWVSKLVAQSLPILFQFVVGIVSAGVRKYALVLKALEIPLSLVGWALTSLATFVPVMTLNPDNRKNRDLKTWEKTVQNILFAALFSTIVLTIEKLIIQLISISYHRKQFDTKIKDSKRNIYLLGLLYEASTALFPAYCAEFANEDYVINDQLDLISSKGSSKHARSGSATPMRLIHNVGRVGDKITAAFGNVAQEITGKEVFNPTSSHSVVIEALEKTRSSEALARRIWMSFVMEGKEALYQEDITDVLGPDRKAEAEECFACLDRDGNGDISLDEMILTVCEFGRERHSISNSMHDVDQAINVLDNLLLTVVFIVVIFIFIALLNRSFTTTLATAGTALLSLSFVFAATAQEVLGSCIFLFVKHPFDVGDRVDIGTELLIVERISLLFTVFRKVKDQKTTQVANIVLNTNWIENVSRSKAMREAINIPVNLDTSLEDVQLLKNEMQNFVRNKDNSRDFQPDVDVEVMGIGKMDQMELKIEIRHKSNWANGAVAAARRSKFMCALVLAMRKVPIYGPGAGGAALGEPGNPTYSVTVTDSQAIEARQDFGDQKDAKRMVPLNQVPKGEESAATSPATGKTSTLDYSYGKPGYSEMRAVDALNTRAPGIDPARDDSAEYYRDETNNAPAPAPSPDAEGKRSQDIEGVRDMLRRESTRGRRKLAGSPTSMSPPSSRIPTIQEPRPTIAAPPPLRTTNNTGGNSNGNRNESNNYRPSPVTANSNATQAAILGGGAVAPTMHGSGGDGATDFHDYEYSTPQIPPQAPNRQMSQSPTSYQSNNPYGRTTVPQAYPLPQSGGVTSPTRRPVPGQGQGPGRY